MAPEATPGVTLNSLARECASCSVALIARRASSRFQIRARTWDGGWRNSKAKVMRRRTAGQVWRAEFEVHSVGTGARSSSRFRNILEPPARRWGKP